MKHVYMFITVSFLCIALPYGIVCIIDDAQHPERWGDPYHSFPLEMSMIAVGAIIIGYLVWDVRRFNRRFPNV